MSCLFLLLISRQSFEYFGVCKPDVVRLQQDRHFSALGAGPESSSRFRLLRWNFSPLDDQLVLFLVLVLDMFRSKAKNLKLEMGSWLEETVDRLSAIHLHIRRFHLQFGEITMVRKGEGYLVSRTAVEGRSNGDEDAATFHWNIHFRLVDRQRHFKRRQNEQWPLSSFTLLLTGSNPVETSVFTIFYGL